MRSRGFTLIELMVVVAVASIVAASMGALHLEMRVSGARVEAELELGREASLATEWLRRDLRGATSTQSDGAELVIERAAGVIRYRIDGGRLIRDDGAPRALGRRFESIAIERVSERLDRVVLRLERGLAASGSARIERSFVAARSP